MRPQKQMFRHKPEDGIYGDCHRAAVATILDLPIEDVPHFAEGGVPPEEFWGRCHAFLEARGWCAITVIYADKLGDVLRSIHSQNPDIAFLLGGTSGNGVGHTVVCCNGEIVHDPAIDNSGIVGPMDDGYYWVTYIGSTAAKQRAA